MTDIQNHQTDDVVTRAVVAIRQMPIPEGPSPLAASQALTALHAAAARPRPPWMYRLSWKSKAAALIGIAATALIAYAMLSSADRGSVAVAQMAEKLRTAHTFCWDGTVYSGDKEVQKFRTWTMDPNRVRTEYGEKLLVIDDFAEGKEIMLNPQDKTAVVRDLKMPTATGSAESKNVAQSEIDRLRSLPERKDVRKLGQREIDHVVADGFEAPMGRGIMTVWINAKSGDPLRIETLDSTFSPPIRSVMTNIRIDEKLEPGFFSLQPPEGNKVTKSPPIDLSATPAECLVQTLGVYAQESDGDFPQNLNEWEKIATIVGQSTATMNKQKGEQLRMGDARLGAYIGLHKPGIDYEYYSGGKLGDKDRIVFWYKDDKTGEYTAVYGDLRVEKIDKEKLPPPQENDANK